MIPCTTRGGIHPRTFQSYNATHFPKVQNRVLFMPTDRPTTSARSDAIRIAKEFKAESVLFIDSDMEWEPDAYDRLTKVKGDIVCGLFWSRSCPSNPTAKVKFRAEDGTDAVKPIIPDEKVQDIDCTGMAFTLIRKPVLDWAEHPAFQHLGAMSEDYVFCLKAREAGFTIRCDTGLKISHRGDVAFNGHPFTFVPESSELSFPFGVTRERESWKIAK